MKKSHRLICGCTSDGEILCEQHKPEPMKPSLSPRTVDISTITEYGLTQKLSNSIRCF